MKKLSRYQRIRQRVIARKRDKRRLSSKKRAFCRHRDHTLQPRQRPSRDKHWKKSALGREPEWTIDLEAPKVFGLFISAHRAPLMKFLDQLKRDTLVLKYHVKIDFSHTDQMLPDGTLLFAAEVDRINRLSNGRRMISCTYPTDNVVEQVLQHLGLLEMMGKSARTQITADNVKFWRVMSGIGVDGSKTEPVIAEYESLLRGQSSDKLYSGLVEAMTNCKHHAYTQPRQDVAGIPGGDLKKWWMFCQHKDGRLFIAICDLGIGIRASLREGRRWSLRTVLETIAMLRLGRNDSSYIKAAMELGRSRTQHPNRGNGFADIREVIGSLGRGRMTIFSHRGAYDYDAKTKAETAIDFKETINGTIVMWTIPTAPEA